MAAGFLKRLNQNQFAEALFVPVHPATVGLFRIVLGLVFLYEFTDSWARDYICNQLPQASFHLTYEHFHWIKPMDSAGMNALFNVLAAASVFLILGIFSRAASACIFLGWTYSQFICSSVYNNHYYLLSLLAFLFIFLNSENWGSIRSWIGRKGAVPGKIPAWQPGLLKFQISIVYFFGAMAKANADWFHGYPMKIWLPSKETWFAGEWLKTEAAAMFFSYGGFVFDLLIVPALLWKRTRLFALIPIFIFHLPNHFLWNIGVFPWFMLAATSIFFDPEWPAKAWQKIYFLLKTGRNRQAPAGRKPKKENLAAAMANKESGGPAPSKNFRLIISTLIGAYASFQIAMPLRQALFPGDSGWTGEGFYFSWNMMLADRPYAYRFKVTFRNRPSLELDMNCQLIDRDRRIYPCGNDKGNMWFRQFTKLGHQPKNIVRYSRYIGKLMVRGGLPAPDGIYPVVWRQYNNRPYQLVLDSTANLLTCDYSEWKRLAIIRPMQNLPYKEKPDLLTKEEMEVFFPGQ